MRNEQIENLNRLPDDAVVSVAAWPMLAGISVSTAWYRAAKDPEFPKPVRLGERCTRWRLGDIRRFLVGEPSTATSKD